MDRESYRSAKDIEPERFLLIDNISVGSDVISSLFLNFSELSIRGLGRKDVNAVCRVPHSRDGAVL